MKNRIKNSCINEFDPSALDENTALTNILKNIKPVKGFEMVSIKKALGRITASNIKSKINLPSFKNSAMDGYAINIDNLKKNNYILYEKATTLAGMSSVSNLKNGETIRVMTGALIPENCNAVIMKEMVEKSDTKIIFGKKIINNQNIRDIGEDVKKSSIVIEKGIKLNYIHLGLLSSLGISSIRVYKKPTISFFSTGNELISVNKILKKGMIYDSNRYILHGLLSKLPIIIKDMGVVKDREDLIIKKLLQCSKISDVIITTGGVSVGDADYIKSALRKVGKIKFWKISIKPGRPLAYGKINKTDFFGLPGNPVSTAVTFQLFVEAAINKLINNFHNEKFIIKGVAGEKLTKKKGRTEYKRAIFNEDKGTFYVKSSGLQGSNILTSLAKANCYIRLSAKIDSVEKGDIVDIIPFNHN